MDKIPFSIRQNSDAELYLDVSGRGSEPKIIFDRTLLEFDPQLPFSSGTIAEVTVSNPTPYPVEFYSLECDKQYTQDEEVKPHPSPLHYILILFLHRFCSGCLNVMTGKAVSSYLFFNLGRHYQMR